MGEVRTMSRRETKPICPAERMVCMAHPTRDTESTMRNKANWRDRGLAGHPEASGDARPTSRNKANSQMVGHAKQSQFALPGSQCARKGIRRNALRRHYKRALPYETKPMCPAERTTSEADCAKQSQFATMSQPASGAAGVLRDTGPSSPAPL